MQTAGVVRHVFIKMTKKSNPQALDINSQVNVEKKVESNLETERDLITGDQNVQPTVNKDMLKEEAVGFEIEMARNTKEEDKL